MSPKLEALADALAPLIAERLAGHLAELVADGAAAPAFVDAAEIARRFGCSRDFVYEHATELGAVRLGDGPKARLRFDPARVAQVLGNEATEPAPRRNGRRTPRQPKSTADLLPVKEKPRP